MQNEREKARSRREFLKVAASIAGAAVVSGGGAVLLRDKKRENLTAELWRLNPAFRIREMSPDAIELFTHLKNGERLQHRFEGVDADLFRTVAEEKKLDEALAAIAKRNDLNESECARRLDRSIRELREAKLVYTGEKMLVKMTG